MDQQPGDIDEQINTSKYQSHQMQAWMASLEHRLCAFTGWQFNGLDSS
jgi:hypothetical protein